MKFSTSFIDEFKEKIFAFYPPPLTSWQLVKLTEFFTFRQDVWHATATDGIQILRGTRTGASIASHLRTATVAKTASNAMPKAGSVVHLATATAKSDASFASPLHGKHWIILPFLDRKVVFSFLRFEIYLLSITYSSTLAFLNYGSCVIQLHAVAGKS